VGKLEHLRRDFSTVCEQIGLDLELPHENASEHDTWRSYYTDETAALVAEAFQDDIETFGYSFE
jgi:hypothetical protein